MREQCAAGGESYVRLRIDVAEERNRPENLRLGEPRQMLERRARNRHQRVQRDRVNAELREADGHVETVFPGLPHADDAAGARTHALSLHLLQGLDLHLVGMRRADIREIPAGSLDIMVIGRHTGLVEAMELLRRKKSHRRAKLDSGLPVHRFVGMDRLLEFCTRQRLAGRHDREAVHALSLVHAAGLEDLLLRQEIVNLTARVMMRRLRTVLAVLRAATAARIDDRAKVDVIAHTGRTDAVRTLAECLEITVQEPVEIVRAGDAPPCDDLVRQCARVQCLQCGSRWLRVSACCP